MWDFECRFYAYQKTLSIWSPLSWIYCKFPFLLAYSLIRAELAEAFIIWYAFQIQMKSCHNIPVTSSSDVSSVFFHPSFINPSHLSGFYQSTWSIIKRSHALPSCWPCLSEEKICAAGFQFLYRPRVFPVSRCEWAFHLYSPKLSAFSHLHCGLALSFISSCAGCSGLQLGSCALWGLLTTTAICVNL